MENHGCLDPRRGVQRACIRDDRFVRAPAGTRRRGWSTSTRRRVRRRLRSRCSPRCCVALVGVAVASMDVSATLLAATASAALRDRFRRDRAPSSAARARRRPRDARADLAVFDHYSAADPLPTGSSSARPHSSCWSRSGRLRPPQSRSSCATCTGRRPRRACIEPTGGKSAAPIGAHPDGRAAGVRKPGDAMRGKREPKLSHDRRRPYLQGSRSRARHARHREDASHRRGKHR